MTNARRLIAAAALAAAAAGLSPAAIAGVQPPINVEMYCPQMAALLPLNYSLARSLVPVEYEVLQVAPGYALLMVGVQDCLSIKVNGDEIGKTPFVHFWIKVAGPVESVDVLPGVSANRDYFYSVFEHTTPNLLRRLSGQLGVQGDPIDSLTLGDLVPTFGDYAVRAGGVIEKALGGFNGFGYQWQANALTIPTIIAPMVHTFYHTKNAGMKAESDVRCMVWINGTGTVQLTIDPRSQAAVFGSVLTGDANHLTMRCNATMSQIK